MRDSNWLGDDNVLHTTCPVGAPGPEGGYALLTSPYCCRSADGSTCECDNVAACSGGDTQVPSCSVDVLANVCPLAGETVVTNCESESY